MSFTSRLFCYLSAKNDKARDAGLTTPDDVFRFNNIAYGRTRKWQRLDVYRPKLEEKGEPFQKLPVIISVHGGGWVYGTKEVYQFYCMSLAQMGFAVVNFNYRLAPEYKFPKSIEDTDRVFAWVRANADKYGFDTGRIFAVGDSAGGHMLALYTALCCSEEYAALIGFSPLEGRRAPDAVAFNCAVFTINFDGKCNPHLKKLIQGLLPHKGTPKEIEMINPLPFMNDLFPPTYLMRANGDMIVAKEQADAMIEKLEDLGVEYVSKVYGTKEKPLDHVFHCNIKTVEAAKCNRDECAFFRDHM